MEGRDIEKVVQGRVHGNDVCAGFERDWVELLELNETLAAPGTKETLDTLVQQMRKGDIQVFRGNYIGVNPADPDDTIDLSQGYEECRTCSCPGFRWILRDVIEISRDEVNS